MTRRDLLRLTACAAASMGGAEFFDAWLQAAMFPAHHQSTAPPEPPLLRDYKPSFFDAGDFGALKALTEILIPTDDTPGAREAHCAHFIDFVLSASSEAAPETGRQWREAMRVLRAAGFHDASGPDREAIVAAMARPERVHGASHPAYGAYRLIKQHNTFAFYTSRAGLIEALDYKGNTYNLTFPGCDHPEHRSV